MITLADSSLATRLRLIIVSVVGALLLLSSAFSIIYITYDAYRASETVIANHAQVVSTNLSAALAFEDELGTQSVLNSMGDDSHIASALVVNKDGHVIASLGETQKIESRLASIAILSNFSGSIQLRTMFLASEVLQGEERLGYLLIEAEHTAVIENLLRQLFATVLILLLMMLLVIPLSKRLAQSVSKPIVSLMKTMEDVSNNDDFSIRAAKTSNDETGFLVDQFNTMLRQIEERDQRLIDYSRELERFIEELEETKEAAIQASEVKSQFLANMSHEIRTPMNGVVGMLDLLKDCTISSEQRDYVEVASRSATGLLSIINDILDLSKIEAGKMTLNPEPIAPGEIVEEVLNIMYQVADRKNINLLGLIEPEAFDCFELDPTRFRQVLLNLIGNAVKFTHEGHVSVECGISENDGKRRMIVKVRDTGIGVSSENHHKLFEAFDQADGSMTRQYGGTGLGLAICRQVVQLMNGEISFESELEKGSVFTFDVPVSPSQEVNESATSEGCDLTVASAISDELLEKSINYLLKSLNIESVKYDPSARVTPDIVVSDDEKFQVDSVRVLHLVKRHSKEQDLGDKLVLPVRRSTLKNVLHNVERIEYQPSITRSTTLSHAKVLLVEDNMINQMVAAKMLEKLGVDCDKAKDGLEAVEKSASQEFDLILMDCQMPNMDGFEATAEIRKIEKTTGSEHIPIVALTANAMEEDERKCIEAGMDDYMAKPIESKLMEQTLRKWLPPQ